MKAGRAVSGGAPKSKATDNHGSIKYARLAKSEKSVSIRFTFVQALKLSVAVQECVLALNRHNQNEGAGKDMGLLLTFLTDGEYVTVTERRVMTDVD